MRQDELIARAAKYLEISEPVLHKWMKLAGLSGLSPSKYLLSLEDASALLNYIDLLGNGQVATFKKFLELQKDQENPGRVDRAWDILDNLHRKLMYFRWADATRIKNQMRRDAQREGEVFDETCFPVPQDRFIWPRKGKC